MESWLIIPVAAARGALRCASRPGLSATFADIEHLLLPSDDVGFYDRAFNLWQLLWSSVQAGMISAEEAKLQERHDLLVAGLKKIEKTPGRPNSQAHARMLQAVIHLVDAHGDEDGVRTAFQEIGACFQESAKLGWFPDQQFYLGWRDQPAANDLPRDAILHSRQRDRYVACLASACERFLKAPPPHQPRVDQPPPLPQHLQRKPVVVDQRPPTSMFLV